MGQRDRPPLPLPQAHRGQFEAGQALGRLAGEYYLAIGAPPPYERPGTLGTLGLINGYGLGDDPPVDSPEGRRCARGGGGTSARWKPPLPPWARLAEALRYTVELDKAPVGVAGLEALRAGLDRLGRTMGAGEVRTRAPQTGLQKEAALRRNYI